MEILLEIICQLLWLCLEVIVQLFPEFFVSLGMQSFLKDRKNRRDVDPVLSAFGYTIYGAAAGAVSLMIFPQLFVTGPLWQKINLFATPLVCGGIMGWYGRYRTRKGQEIVRLDSFVYGFLFAFAMALMRYGYHHFGVFK